MLMMMVRNEDDDDDDDDDGEEARSKAMHESAFRSDAWRRVPKRGPYPFDMVCVYIIISNIYIYIITYIYIYIYSYLFNVFVIKAQLVLSDFLPQRATLGAQVYRIVFEVHYRRT